ncbi:MAG: hypothetical protein JWN13_2860 [Betaproteobacteria bacterium]|nr:hypothetical protein [Betaproteobacteria bacterium]
MGDGRDVCLCAAVQTEETFRNRQLPSHRGRTRLRRKKVEFLVAVARERYLEAKCCFLAVSGCLRNAHVPDVRTTSPATLSPLNNLTYTLLNQALPGSRWKRSCQYKDTLIVGSEMGGRNTLTPANRFMDSASREGTVAIRSVLVTSAATP